MRVALRSRRCHRWTSYQPFASPHGAPLRLSLTHSLTLTHRGRHSRRWRRRCLHCCYPPPPRLPASTSTAALLLVLSFSATQRQRSASSAPALCLSTPAAALRYPPLRAPPPAAPRNAPRTEPPALSATCSAPLAQRHSLSATRAVAAAAAAASSSRAVPTLLSARCMPAPRASSAGKYTPRAPATPAPRARTP